MRGPRRTPRGGVLIPIFSRRSHSPRGAAISLFENLILISSHYSALYLSSRGGKGFFCFFSPSWIFLHLRPSLLYLNFSPATRPSLPDRPPPPQGVIFPSLSVPGNEVVKTPLSRS